MTDHLTDRPEPQAGRPIGQYTATELLHVIAAEYDRLQAVVDGFHHGEEVYTDQRVAPNAGQMIWQWNRATPEQRLDMATRVQGAWQQALDCSVNGHAERLADRPELVSRAFELRGQLEREQRTTAAALDVAAKLTASLHSAEDELAEWRNRADLLERTEAERDAAYRERAQLLAWLAAMHDAVLTMAPDTDEPGWRILYLTAAGHQLSWHIAPADVSLFEHIEHVPSEDPRAQWDGHTTEQKYRRIAELVHSLRGCPTPCDENCEATCHEVHAVSWKRDHEPCGDRTRVQALEETLREVLGRFVHRVHPGREARQSDMVGVDVIEQWRAVLNQRAAAELACRHETDLAAARERLDAARVLAERLRGTDAGEWVAERILEALNGPKPTPERAPIDSPATVECGHVDPSDPDRRCTDVQYHYGVHEHLRWLWPNDSYPTDAGVCPTDRCFLYGGHPGDHHIVPLPPVVDHGDIPF